MKISWLCLYTKVPLMIGMEVEFLSDWKIRMIFISLANSKLWNQLPILERATLDYTKEEKMTIQLWDWTSIKGLLKAYREMLPLTFTTLSRKFLSLVVISTMDRWCRRTSKMITTLLYQIGRRNLVALNYHWNQGSLLSILGKPPRRESAVTSNFSLRCQIWDNLTTHQKEGTMAPLNSFKALENYLCQKLTRLNPERFILWDLLSINNNLLYHTITITLWVVPPRKISPSLRT